MAQDQETWRADWVVDDDPVASAHAVHKSGLSFSMVYTEVDEEGSMGWTVAPTPQCERDLAKMAAELGPDRWVEYLDQLGWQCYRLWLELGYTDDSPFKVR